MTEREAFIAAIAADPAADAPRLVFADWLDEHGETARAGFIRDQVQLAKLRPGSDEYRTLFRRTADTLRANLPAWIADVCDAFGVPTDDWMLWKALGPRLRIVIGRKRDLVLEPLTLAGVEFSRGLIDRAVVRLRRLSESGPLGTLLREHPVIRLDLTGFPRASDAWVRVAVPELGRVQTLVSHHLPPEAATEFLGAGVWTGVRRLHLQTTAPLVPQLRGSPMARQLVGLKLNHHSENFDHLAHFPLDDRLQEFAITPTRASPSNRENTPAMMDISKLPQVSFRPTLKRLDLTDCTVGDRGLATFARGDVWLRLRALVLDRNRFGDPGWRDFVRSRRTPELRLLSASRNFVTGDGAGRLGRSPLADTLEYVDLRGNRIDGKGAVTLARSLAGGPLKKLLLAGNPIAARDAAAVRQVLGPRVDVGG